MKKFAITLLICLSLAGASSAATVTQTEGFSGTPDFTKDLTFDAFDTSLGFLNSVYVEVEVLVTAGEFLVDNDSPTVGTVDIDFGIDAQLISGGEVIIPGVQAIAGDSAFLVLAPDDGDGPPIDGSTPDGATLSMVGLTDADFATITGGLALASYLDTNAGPDYVIRVDTSQFFAVSGASGIDGGFRSADAIGDVTVIYDYTVPEPTTMGLLAVGGLAALRRRKK